MWPHHGSRRRCGGLQGGNVEAMDGGEGVGVCGKRGWERARRCRTRCRSEWSYGYMCMRFMRSKACASTIEMAKWAARHDMTWAHVDTTNLGMGLFGLLLRRVMYCHPIG